MITNNNKNLSKNIVTQDDTSGDNLLVVSLMKGIQILCQIKVDEKRILSTTFEEE